MRTVNCEQLEAAIDAAVESRGDIAWDSVGLDESCVADHVADCCACREKLDEFQLLNSAIGAWQSNVPSVDFADSLMDMLASSASTQESGQSSVRSNDTRPSVSMINEADASDRSRFSVLAVAAVALAVTAAVIVVSTTPNDPSRPNSVAQDNVKTNPVEIVENNKRRDPIGGNPLLAGMKRPTVGLGDLVRDANGAWQELASTTAVTVIEDVDELLPERQDSGSETEVVEADDSSWVQELTTEMKPIGDDVGKAFGFLVSAVEF